MTAGISARTPQQALAALLDLHQPKRLLLLGASQFPALEGLPPTNDDGQGTQHTYVPWWGYGKQKELGFPRGYHIEYWGGMGQPSYGTGGGMDAMRKYIKDEFGNPIVYYDGIEKTGIQALKQDIKVLLEEK